MESILMSWRKNSRTSGSKRALRARNDEDSMQTEPGLDLPVLEEGREGDNGQQEGSSVGPGTPVDLATLELLL